MVMVTPAIFSLAAEGKSIPTKSAQYTHLRGIMGRIRNVFKYFIKLTSLCLQAFPSAVQLLKFRNWYQCLWNLNWLFWWMTKDIIYHRTDLLSHCPVVFSLYPDTLQLGSIAIQSPALAIPGERQLPVVMLVGFWSKNSIRGWAGSFFNACLLECSVPAAQLSCA